MLARILDVLGSVLSGQRPRGLNALVAIGLALALAAIAWTIFIPEIQIRLDPAQLLYGIAACIAAWGFFTLMSRRPTRSSTVVVNYDFRLTQPTLPTGRYRFDLEIFYEREVHGRHERERQAMIELTFKRHEHADIWFFCNREIARLLQDHLYLAKERYPNAVVLSAPPPQPERPAVDITPTSEHLPADA